MNKISDKDTIPALFDGEFNITTNSCNSTVDILHVPSGIRFVCSEYKSRYKNKEKALEMITVKLIYARVYCSRKRRENLISS